MLKREITYENFDGETVTEVFYFNLTKSEMIELEVSYKDGLESVIKKIIAAEDNESLIAEFKKIILLSYGEKSEDGKRFVKSDAIREGFSQTAAYDALFMDIATNEETAAVFIKGIIPKDMAIEVDKIQDKPQEIPQPPTLPGTT